VTYEEKKEKADATIAIGAFELGQLEYWKAPFNVCEIRQHVVSRRKSENDIQLPGPHAIPFLFQFVDLRLEIFHDDRPRTDVSEDYITSQCVYRRNYPESADRCACCNTRSLYIPSSVAIRPATFTSARHVRQCLRITPCHPGMSIDITKTQYASEIVILPRNLIGHDQL